MTGAAAGRYFGQRSACAAPPWPTGTGPTECIRMQTHTRRARKHARAHAPATTRICTPALLKSLQQQSHSLSALGSARPHPYQFARLLSFRTRTRIHMRAHACAHNRSNPSTDSHTHTYSRKHVHTFDMHARTGTNTSPTYKAHAHAPMVGAAVCGRARSAAG
jgi:hypothetical protein